MFQLRQTEPRGNAHHKGTQGSSVNVQGVSSCFGLLRENPRKQFALTWCCQNAGTIYTWVSRQLSPKRELAQAWPWAGEEAAITPVSTELFYLYLCVCVVCPHAWTCPQRPEGLWESLELRSQVVSCPGWVLRTDLVLWKSSKHS